MFSRLEKEIVEIKGNSKSGRERYVFSLFLINDWVIFVRYRLIDTHESARTETKSRKSLNHEQN